MNRFGILMLVASLLVAAPTLAQDDVNITILQWSHFVPTHDQWFDAWAEEWGEANNVGVRVDHVDIEQIPQTLSASISAGDGHSIYEMIVPAFAFVQGLHPLNDINAAAVEAHGAPAETCPDGSYLAIADMYFGFAHGYLPGPGHYVKSLWEAAGYPEGPTTWQDLLEGGRAIYESSGVPVGMGISPEPDSQAGILAAIWSFGGGIQDEDENVVFNSPETIEAVNYYAQLYREAMTPEVLAWSPASDNQALIAGEASYILNPISAYRTLQHINPEAAADIGLAPALAGPAGPIASTHGWLTYIIPTYVQGDELEAAKQFILDHTANYRDAVLNSALYNFPCFPSTVPDLQILLENDPFGSVPADKLTVLSRADEWSVFPGYPGPSNPAVLQFFSENWLANVVASVALGERTAEDAVAEAHARAEVIFEEWRALGLVGGGESQ